MLVHIMVWIGGRGAAPLMDSALFRERAFSAGLLTQLAFWCGQAAFFLVLALYLMLGGMSVGAGIELLAPGLLLVGAGMGFCITPLTTIVLGSIDARRAGAVSGTLSTM